MTIEEAQELLKDWESHGLGSVPFEGVDIWEATEPIKKLLEAQKIVEQQRCAEIVAKEFPSVYTHLSGHSGNFIREEYMHKMKKRIEKEILDSP